ncbi:hypothetical protein [Ascidiimonas aurantiaca]|uniref:hypothetical protein n=1 Tax=Ascidiimonas aurantiaca TaxID=1685432 RepID=UPI0030EE1F90
MSEFPDIYSLLDEAEKQKLYQKLVVQLKKDLRSAQIYELPEDTVKPEALKTFLQQTVLHLINHNFATYLNLLYIVDVHESQIKQLDGADVGQLSEGVTFLILKREWQKVWIRNNLSK